MELQKLQAKLHIDHIKPRHPLAMAVLALLVGIISGLGAVLFRKMIAFVHNLLFLGRFSFIYDTNSHTINHWGAYIILVPVIGGIIVSALIKHFAPEAKGRGVPEVMESVFFHKGIIRPIVAVIKAIASSICIGSGGSVGREGPIIQIGSSLGSTLGQIVSMPASQRVMLVAAGASAGIAATFNAPIGGIAFAIELLVVSVNTESICILSIATVTATYIGRYFLGINPAFDIQLLAMPAKHMFNLENLIAFVPLGIILGIASALFIHIIYWFEDMFDDFGLNDYLKHMIGNICLGIMLYLLMKHYGHYYVAGVGYATIGDILTGLLNSPGLLLLLFGAKLIATSLSLGSGGSGGIFSPALFLGASLGCLFGLLAGHIMPHYSGYLSTFAVAGMASMIAGTTGAVLTAIIMIFEMTRDYSSILPIIITVAIAYGVRVAMSKSSIYTLKLIRKGLSPSEGWQAVLQFSGKAQDIMVANFNVIPFDSGLISELEPHSTNILTDKEDNILEVLDLETLTLGQNDLTQGIPKIKHDFLVITPNIRLLKLLNIMRETSRHVFLISSNPNSGKAKDIIGVITDREITNLCSDASMLMSL